MVCKNKLGVTTTKREGLFKQKNKTGGSTNGYKMAVNKFRLETGFQTSKE